MLFKNLAYAHQANTGARYPHENVLSPPEAAEKMREIARGNADALITDRQPRPGCAGSVHFRFDLDDDITSFRAIFDRVRKQIRHDPFDPVLIPSPDHALLISLNH